MSKLRGGLRVCLNVGLDKHHFLKISPLMHVQMSSSAHTRACTHTWHRSALEIRLTGGNCGLYYSKRYSPCVNHSKLHPDERLKLAEQTGAPSTAAPPLPREEGEIHISWLWSPFPWAAALQLERKHHSSTAQVSSQQVTTTWAPDPCMHDHCRCFRTATGKLPWWRSHVYDTDGQA